MSTLAAVRQLLSSALDLALTRAEFASVELAQARAQLVRWLVLSLATIMLATLALLALSALVVAALWPQVGWVSILVLAIAYGGAAWMVLRRLLGEVGEAGPLLEQTMAELRRDREALLGPSSAPSGSREAT